MEALVRAVGLKQVRYDMWFHPCTTHKVLLPVTAASMLPYQQVFEILTLLGHLGNISLFSTS